MILKWYIEKKYGRVHALKPPIGWCYYTNPQPSIFYKISYYIKKIIWWWDCWLHRRAR